MTVHPTLRSVVYGAEEADLDDPAEHYHEASKLYPALAARQTVGVVQLASSTALQEVTTHAGQRNLQLPAVPLPPPLHLQGSLRSAL